MMAEEPLPRAPADFRRLLRPGEHPLQGGGDLRRAFGGKHGRMLGEAPIVVLAIVVQEHRFGAGHGLGRRCAEAAEHELVEDHVGGVDVFRQAALRQRRQPDDIVVELQFPHQRPALLHFLAPVGEEELRAAAQPPLQLGEAVDDFVVPLDRPIVPRHGEDDLAAAVLLQEPRAAASRLGGISRR